MSFVVCLSFEMITYSVGADEVASLEAPLENEKPFVRLVEGFWEF